MLPTTSGVSPIAGPVAELERVEHDHLVAARPQLRDRV